MRPAFLLRVLVVVMLALVPAAAAAPPTLPPGFTTEVYVTGDGYTADAWRGLPGIPSTGTMAVDADGVVVGSALVAALAEAADIADAVVRAGRFLAPLRVALDGGIPALR